MIVPTYSAVIIATTVTHLKLLEKGWGRYWNKWNKEETKEAGT